MDFYVDSAFLSQLLMNYLCIEISCGILKYRSGIKKKLLFSVVLSLLGVASVILGRIRYLYLIPYILMLVLFYGKSNTAEQIRRCFITVGVSFLITAVMLYMVPTEQWHINGQLFYVADDKNFYLSIIPTIIISKLILLFISSKKRIYEVRIRINDEVIIAKALYDTGNNLRVPSRGNPVIIIDKRIINNVPSTQAIECRTASGLSRVQAFPIDELQLMDERIRIDNAYAAVSEEKLEKDDRYSVILHNSFL